MFSAVRVAVTTTVSTAAAAGALDKGINASSDALAHTNRNDTEISVR
jgi:hypothetical protein